jgi:predicted MFS family arabinose efflux permease
VLALVIGGRILAHGGWRMALTAIAIGAVLCVAITIRLLRDGESAPRAFTPSGFRLDAGLAGNRTA